MKERECYYEDVTTLLIKIVLVIILIIVKDIVRGIHGNPFRIQYSHFTRRSHLRSKFHLTRLTSCFIGILNQFVFPLQVKEMTTPSHLNGSVGQSDGLNGLELAMLVLEKNNSLFHQHPHLNGIVGTVGIQTNVQYTGKINVAENWAQRLKIQSRNHTVYKHELLDIPLNSNQFDDILLRIRSFEMDWSGIIFWTFFLLAIVDAVFIKIYFRLYL